MTPLDTPSDSTRCSDSANHELEEPYAMKAGNYQRTGDDCPVCDDGEILKGDYEKFCDTCHTVIDADAFVHEEKGAWERWWDHRDEEYDGMYGDKRIKGVGGFESVWFYTDDEYIEG